MASDGQIVCRCYHYQPVRQPHKGLPPCPRGVIRRVQFRSQIMLLPPCLDDYVSERNAVRVIDAFVGTLDLPALGFEHAEENCGCRSAGVRTGAAAEAVSVRLPAPGAKFAPSRSGDAAQSGSEVAVSGCVAE